jgi:hypothetical protein
LPWILNLRYWQRRKGCATTDNPEQPLGAALHNLQP